MILGNPTVAATQGHALVLRSCRCTSDRCVRGHWASRCKKGRCTCIEQGCACRVPRGDRTTHQRRRVAGACGCSIRFRVCMGYDRTCKTPCCKGLWKSRTCPSYGGDSSRCTCMHHGGSDTCLGTCCARADRRCACGYRCRARTCPACTGPVPPCARRSCCCMRNPWR